MLDSLPKPLPAQRTFPMTAHSEKAVPIRILGISGSLRAESSNSTLIRLAAALPDPEVGFEIYRGLGGLPFFSPERDDANASAEVGEFRAALKRADGILICTPEYAFGMPGALKN